MGEWQKVQATDGHQLSVYEVRPEGAARGSVVLVQEIFGVNAHIRSVADRLAAEGYAVAAPALFDRYEPGVDLTYQGEDIKRAFALYARLDPATALLDVAAAFESLSGEGSGTAVLGFCFGGLMAWLAATRGPEAGIAPRCTIGYYAGGIGKVAQEAPTCPVMLHFGAEDTHIGAEQVQAVQQAHPEVEVYGYEGAGHAFNRDADPGSYHATAAQLAWERTLHFLEQNLHA